MLSTIPSLAGGVIVAAIGYRLSQLLPRPLLDRRLGLPRPAITSLTLGVGPVSLFVDTMLVGMTAHDRLIPRLIPTEPMKGARP